MMAIFKTPSKIQFEATECGAVSLSIILGYYGKWPNLEEIRIRCKVGRDEPLVARAGILLPFAERFGFLYVTLGSEPKFFRSYKSEFRVKGNGAVEGSGSAVGESRT